MVAFDVEVPAVANSSNTEGATDYAPTGATAPAKMGCIFKVGDDIRQDVLAIQVSVYCMNMLREWPAVHVLFTEQGGQLCLEQNHFG